MEVDLYSITGSYALAVGKPFLHRNLWVNFGCHSKWYVTPEETVGGTPEISSFKMTWKHTVGIMLLSQQHI